GLYFSYVCSLFPSWSPDSSQYPAIHIQNLTVNKVTPATGQKNCRTLQIIRIAPLASGCALQNKFIQRIARCSNRCCLLGGKITRANAVHLDVVASPFRCHAAG